MKKKGTKSFDYIKKVKRRVEQKMLKKKNVNGVGVGIKVTKGKPTGEPVISVFVDKKADDIPVKERIPRQIYGIKTDVIERKGYVKPHDLDPDKLRPYNPVIAGAAVGPARMFGNNQFQRGTLGAICINNRTGEPMILSCYHVLAVDNKWSLGDTILQPPDQNNRVVGNLAGAFLLESEGLDAAVATISVGIAHAVAGIGPTNGSAPAILNEPVKKWGIATGLTTGTIMHLDVPAVVDYSALPYGLGTKTLSHQIAITPPTFSAEADSGSAVLDNAGKIVGLLIGADDKFAYANNIETVLNRFDIRIP